jgi:anti-sigma factor ChrR (cupin superfamily)
MEKKSHTRPDEETWDHAALYLLGGMGRQEASDFEKHLDVCLPCRIVVSSLRPLVDDLVLAGPEVEPPTALRERVLARARGTSYTRLPEAERAWLPAGVPGVELCQLWLDEASERQTILIRMEAGAALPHHEHGGTEECYVIRGDLRDGHLLLQTGDYIRFERGTRHSISSQEGCLLLVTSSLRDRTIEPPSA